MTDPWRSALLSGDVAPEMAMIDGRLFLDRRGVGAQALRDEVAKYRNDVEAQQWMNSAPIDDFIDFAAEDWSVDDPSVRNIADVYARSWLSLIKSRFGRDDGCSVEVLRDREHGDVWVRLNQALSPGRGAGSIYAAGRPASLDSRGAFRCRFVRALPLAQAGGVVGIHASFDEAQKDAA